MGICMTCISHKMYVRFHIYTYVVILLCNMYCKLCTMSMYEFHVQCSYCPGGPDSDFEYSTQSYTGYEPTSMRAIRARYNPYLQAKHRLEQVSMLHNMQCTRYIHVHTVFHPDTLAGAKSRFGMRGQHVCGNAFFNYLRKLAKPLIILFIF